MPTDPHTIETLLDCLAGCGAVQVKKMFGEYGVYVDGVFIGVVCDDRFHLKPHKSTAALTAGLELAPAYAGAKPSVVIPTDRWDDADWLAPIIRASVAALAKG